MTAGSVIEEVSIPDIGMASYISVDTFPSKIEEVSFNEEYAVIKNSFLDFLNVNLYKNKNRSNIVDFFCNFWFLDVIINSENYIYFPSYFQEVSIKLPFSFSEVNTIYWTYPKNALVDRIEWFFPYDNIFSIYPMLPDDTDYYYTIHSTMPRLPHNTILYDTSYSTMPMLPHDIAMSMAVRDELLWSEIIPGLRSELRINNVEARSLNVLIEILGTHRNQHPSFGSLYDVFTEYIRSYNNTRRLLTNAMNELESLRPLLEHNGNLMEAAGFLESESSSSNESESSSSNGSESNSTDV